MEDSAIDRIGIDVVGPGGFEPAIRVGVDWAEGIAEGAADVDVDVGVAHDQSGIVAAPCPDNFRDVRGSSGGAGDGCEYGQECGDPPHIRTLGNRTKRVNQKNSSSTSR